MRCHSAAVAWLLLAGCASTPKAQPLPALVKVPVPEYVRVPDNLTPPCPVPRAQSRPGEAVVSAYNSKVTHLHASHAIPHGLRVPKPTPPIPHIGRPTSRQQVFPQFSHPQ